MIQTLKRQLLGIYANWASGSRALENTTIFGRSVKVLPGTVRRQADQDDAWFVWLAGHKRNLFDIGANIGFTALLAALRGAERLLLVDPNPTALGRAATNLIYNNLAASAGFVTAFLSDEAGENLPFYTVGAGAASSMYPGCAMYLQTYSCIRVACRK